MLLMSVMITMSTDDADDDEEKEEEDNDDDDDDCYVVRSRLASASVVHADVIRECLIGYFVNE